MEGAKKFYKGSIVRYMHKGVMNKTGVCMRLMYSVTAAGWQVRWLKFTCTQTSKLGEVHVA